MQSLLIGSCLCYPACDVPTWELLPSHIAATAVARKGKDESSTGRMAGELTPLSAKGGERGKGGAIDLEGGRTATAAAATFDAANSLRPTEGAANHEAATSSVSGYVPERDLLPCPADATAEAAEGPPSSPSCAPIRLETIMGSQKSIALAAMFFKSACCGQSRLSASHGTL